MTDIPGRDEPDPQNLRLRSFQGGADGLPDASPDQIPPQYRDAGQTAGASVSTSGTGVTAPAGGVTGVTHSPAGREGGARVRVTEQR
jgi:hypothetical protein